MVFLIDSKKYFSKEYNECKSISYSFCIPHILIVHQVGGFPIVHCTITRTDKAWIKAGEKSASHVVNCRGWIFDSAILLVPGHPMGPSPSPAESSNKHPSTNYIRLSPIHGTPPSLFKQILLPTDYQRRFHISLTAGQGHTCSGGGRDLDFRLSRWLGRGLSQGTH